MNIVRYLRYPQSDLSAALDRITSMRAEMDRMYDSTFGSSFRSLAQDPLAWKRSKREST
jgi:hypothetical protein